VAITSGVVNALLKPTARRHRPDREGHTIPVIRHVAMPESRSLPSGHAASAFAFATAVGHVMPHVAFPLRLAAAAVAYSRVHTGVHYPGDVVAGALTGTVVAQAAAFAAGDRLGRGRA
jgi:undecaprenyl-diphosphatase